MKNHLKIILLCAVAFLVILILWGYNREKKSPTPMVDNSTTNVPLSQKMVGSVTDKQETNASINLSTNATIPEQSQTNSVSPEEKFHALVENKNAQINFWGLVEDQDGNPLVGVKIGGDTRTWHMTTTQNFDASFPKLNTTSDSD